MSAYRYIKGTHGVNPDLQYLLIFDGGLNNALNSILFERFAALLSERLGIHLVWLGSMQMEHGQRSWASSLELEHLFLEEIKKTDTPAKLALAEYIKNQSLKNLEVHV